MSKLKNDTLIRALLREPTPYTPIWLMRQAGRYLPEYNQTRARAGSFLALCKNPDLATEVTLQPLARYALDAAIVFSDILTIPDAMGLGCISRKVRGQNSSARCAKNGRSGICPHRTPQPTCAMCSIRSARRAARWPAACR